MNTVPNWLKALLFAALLLLLAGSARYYRVQKQHRFAEAAGNLEAIAQLKIDWLREWRAERLIEASQIMASRFYGPLAERWTKDAPQEKDTNSVLAAFGVAQRQRRFNNALFVNAAGKPHFRLFPRTGPLSGETLRGLSEAFRERKGVLTQMYADPDDARPQMDLIAPFFCGTGNSIMPAGAIIFQYDAQTSIYPMIQSWPVHSNSAETVLVRVEGNSLVFLNELRYRKGTPLKLRYRLDRQNGIWTRGLLNAQAAMEVRDYRNIKVLAVVKPVPDAGWLMIAKQDESEIFSMLRKEFILMLIGVLLLIAAVSAALAVIWQRKNQVQLQALFEAEAAQRKAEERIRSTMDAMLEGCQIIDFNWRQVYVNDTAIKHSGHTKEELLGHTIMECYPGIENGEVFAAFQRCMNDRTPQLVSDTLVYQAGEERWYEVRIQPVSEGIFVLTNDITSRKRIEIENARLASAIEQLGEVVVVIDTNKIVQYVNPVFEAVTGYKAEEAVGYPLPVDNVQDKEFYHKFWSTLESGRQWRGRLRNRRKDGTLYTEDGTVSPVFDQTGKIVNYVSITRDVTEFLKLQEEKEKLQSQYLQAQKMESVGRLAGGVAHDFNNMLNVIIGYAQLSLDTLEPDHPLYSYLREINSAALHSAELTRQLLAFARRQTIAPQILDLNQTVSGMLTMLQRVIGENIDLSWVPGYNLWSVKVDPSQVDQVLANLAVNARDAISEHGHITIETENVVFDEVYRSQHVDCVPGEYVMLVLSDDGCGMDKEVKDHLFEPFFTTKERGKGTGLGLATVYGIVKQNAGFINVYSEPGKGTSFKIYLPRYSGPDVAAAAAKPERPKGGSETILLVEDEVAVLNLTKTMLERIGYSVIAANSPREAIRLSENYQGEIHLLLVDVVMPEMTGRDLAERLSAQLPKLRQLYMSGYTADVIARHGVLDEGLFFIQKPFSSRALASKIREVLDA